MIMINKWIQRKKTKTGRGGPTILDSLSLDSPEGLLNSASLRQFLYNNSEDYNDTVAQLEDLNKIIERNLSIWRQTPTMIPIRSRALSDRYGMRVDPFTKKRAFHAGIDFRARRGTPVYAPADAVVRIASRKSGFGLLVELRHGRGFLRQYRYWPGFGFGIGYYCRRGILHRSRAGDCCHRGHGPDSGGPGQLFKPGNPDDRKCRNRSMPSPERETPFVSCRSVSVYLQIGRASCRERV